MATPRRVMAPSVDEHAARYINRELSALDFYASILELAEDPSTPLLERVKFTAIRRGQPRRVLRDPRGRAPRAGDLAARHSHVPPPRPVACTAPALSMTVNR